MVAEKPSVSKMIAEHLSKGKMRWRKGASHACQIHEFITWFPPAGQKCKFLQTSVVGHVFGLSFNKEDGRRAWKDPSILFDSNTEKTIEEMTAKLRVVEHLQGLAKEAEYLVLWLDCDREGENIGFEVIGLCRESFPSDENIYRAQFSALTEPEMKRALNTLVRPNKYMSMAVDARQELDLKIGVAFTKLLTNHLLERCQQKFFSDLKVISYGPCQTPTLWFCTQRHHEIQNFKRQSLWSPKLSLELPSLGPSNFAWALTTDGNEQGKISNSQRAKEVENACRKATFAVAGKVKEERKSLRRPAGLNTVQLLKVASSALGMSPAVAMKTAEHLYSSGYISYPRTESTKYPASFDIRAALYEQSWHPNWGRTAHHLLQNNPDIRPPTQGHDAGDHPPITPMRSAPRGELTKGKEWKLYDFITRHFIASLMPDFQYTEHTLTASVGQGIEFAYKWHTVQEQGFCGAMPWKQQDLHLQQVARPPSVMPTARLRILGVTMEEEYTRPPDYLKESELIELMDKHGIGTDASIAQHVKNVIDRHYAKVCGPGEDGKAGKPVPTEEQLYKMRWKAKKGAGKAGGKGKDSRIEEPKSRHMVPTGLGLALIGSYQRLDKTLCEPQVRANMEQQVARIADGSESQEEVLRHNIELFRGKFHNFASQMDTLEPIFRPKQDWGGGDWGGGDGQWSGGGGGGKGQWGGGSGQGKGGGGGAWAGGGQKRKWDGPQGPQGASSGGAWGKGNGKKRQK